MHHLSEQTARLNFAQLVSELVQFAVAISLAPCFSAVISCHTFGNRLNGFRPIPNRYHRAKATVLM